MSRPPFRRRADGAFAVGLRDHEREPLRELPRQLRELLQEESPATDPSLVRLFPPAYPDDPLRNLDYERLAGDALLGDRLEAIDTVERTVDARTLTEDELLAWMHVVNDLRLVLGTRLDVTEDSTERDFTSGSAASAFELYRYLSWLLGAILEGFGEPPTATAG